MKSSFTRKLFITAALALSALHAVAAPAFKVEVSGHGKPMILIPGLASSGEVWQDTVARYAGQYEMHVLTLAGFAGVAPIEGNLLASAEQQLSEYISSKKLGQPVLLGHSLGGFLGMRMAIDHPEQVGKLIIVDALPAIGATQVPTISAAQLAGMAAQMREAILRQDAATFAAGQRRSIASMVTRPADLERIVGWGMQSDRATVAGAMHDVIATDLREDIARIKAPTLVLGTWIAYKDYAPRSVIEANFASQYSKLPGASIALADTARHFIMYDDALWMYSKIDQFLQ